jgi:hypothetical protein
VAKVNDLGYETLDNEKFPSSNSNHVGLEIECFSTKHFDFSETVAKAFIENDLHYQCSVGEDGSINTLVNSKHATSCLIFLNGSCSCQKGSGAEVRVLMPQSKITSTVAKVCSVLKSLGAQVNDSCGLHVHIDIRNRNWKQVAARLMKNQNKLWAVVKEERRASSHCRPISSITSMGHYFCFDFSQVNKLGTIEVRMHHGTVDANEINSFIRMLLEIADGKEESLSTKLYRKRQAHKFEHPFIQKRG